MRLDLLREIPEDPRLRQQWNALAESVEKPQVFYTYDWALAMQRAYRASLRPLLFLACDEQGALCGAAALATDPGEHNVSFLCATTGDYCDFLSSPETKAEFVASVLDELRKLGIQRITLANVPGDSTTLQSLQPAARRIGYFLFARRGYLCAQVSVPELMKSGDQRPHLPRKKMLRRFLNAMGREAPVRLDHARSWESVEPILPLFMRAHVARFLDTGRISNAARAERRAFLSELAKLLCENGWLTLTRMMSGDRVLAWNYGFQFQGTWFWYQPTFASELEKYSPGFCLLARLIEEAVDDEQCKLVDLGLGAEDYKDRFANRTRETLHVSLRSSALEIGAEAVRYRAAATVKAVPMVEHVLRAANQRLGRVSETAGESGLGRALSHAGRRVGRAVSERTEVFFYEWNGGLFPPSNDRQLQALSLDQLASAAMQYADDPDTVAYLLRSAERLRAGTAQGVALVDSAGVQVHFAWATAFDGFFLDELRATVEAPSPDAVMLFDCWTPRVQRGHGFYGQTIELLAARLEAEGKRPWIFSAAANARSLRGLSKAGFQRRYSVVRHKMLWWQRLAERRPESSDIWGAEVSARS